MNRFTLIAGAGLLAFGLGVGVYAAAHEDHNHALSPKGKKVTVEGELLDTSCFVSSDGQTKGKDHMECAVKCMTAGMPAAILPKNSKAATDMRFLLTNPVVLSKYAGKTIKVEGTAYDDMCVVDVTKVFYADGDNWREVKLDAKPSDEPHK